MVSKPTKHERHGDVQGFEESERDGGQSVRDGGRIHQAREFGLNLKSIMQVDSKGSVVGSFTL